MYNEANGVGFDSRCLDRGSEGHFCLLSVINILSERSLAFGLLRTGNGFGRYLQRAIHSSLRLPPHLALLTNFGSIFQVGCIGGDNEDIQLIFVQLFLITIIITNTVETLFGIKPYDCTSKYLVIKDLVEC